MQLTMYRLPKATSRFHLDITLYEAMFGDAAEVTVDFRYAFSSEQFSSLRQLLLLHSNVKDAQLSP
jgi:hypothetical protein